MFTSRSAKVLAWLGVLVFSVPCLAQNDPPEAPLITQPEVDGLILNPADVHMETGPFSDPDPGDDHLCTDWEIWTLDPAERVWFTECIGGVERVHSHLGDGVFENSHAGRDELLPETEYVLRVRHRDDSGQSNDWSPWADRLFQTGEASAVFPLELIDIAQDPAPRWEDTTGVPLALPAGSPPGVLVMDEFDGHLLLELRGVDGDSNEIVNPPALEEHAHPRVVLRAGSVSLSVPESDLIITNELGEQVTVYLPAAALEPGESAVFWISSNGSTYVGDLSQEEPDFAELARGAPVPWSVAQPGFRVEVVATGFQLPVNIAFAPDHGLRHDDDPYYYVSELYGTIKVVLRDGTVADYATGLLNFNPTGNFPGSGEQGLTGLVVDPDTGDVYAAMLYSTDPNNDNAPHYPKVVRFTSNDGGRTAATQTTILDMVGETQGQSHQISNLTFGPDGMLYIHMGDGFDAARAQDLNSFRGKILRIDRNGWVPSDNPFYNASDGFTARDYIYTYGLRNPFGGAWREADGSHYVVENGPSVDRFSKTVRGHNYRWDGSDQSMRNSAIYNWDPAHAPVNIAFVQPSVFGGSGFPAERHGRAFITESGPTWASGYQDRGKRVTEWILDDEGNLVEGERDVVVYNGSGKATAVAIAAGPDGLYFSDLYKDRDYTSPIDRGANILRIRYVGTAEFVADVRAGDRPLTVHFTDLSDVPGASAWEWSFGDGTGSSQQHPTHTYALDGVYTVRLVVRGTAGTVVEQKNGYIKVGQFPTVAMIGGSLPPSPSDQAVADFLSGLGYEVTSFDDDRDLRPSASEIAAQFDAVVVSSTISSSNIAGDFRSEDVPVVFWENALLQADREPMAADHVVEGGTQSVNILDNTHPITQGLSLGALQIYNSPANMSLGRGTIGPEAEVLATRSGAPGDAAIIAAEAGAVLLGGHVAPARRVFLFLEDANWQTTTDAGKTIVERAVSWATGLAQTCPGDFNGDGLVDSRDVLAFLNAWAGGEPTGDCNGDGVIDTRDVLAFLNVWTSDC
ncbi:MAG: PQQ-dependent sugar dehydrogenase [Phycisphaerales bacterium JB054]